jgi:hypothetical protein
LNVFDGFNHVVFYLISFRIDKNTEFETLQLEGEIAENVIKNIENAKKYLSELWYEDLQTIIMHLMLECF